LIRECWIVRAVQLAIDFKGHCDDANTPEIEAATVERIIHSRIFEGEGV
jgi:hypothetical protein